MSNTNSLDQSSVRIRLSLDAPLASPCTLLLMLDGIKAGVIFGQVMRNTDGIWLDLNFSWTAVVNPSVLTALNRQDTLLVSVMQAGAPEQQWFLGEIVLQSLTAFLQPEPSTSDNVLIETARQCQSGQLPSISSPRVESDVTLVAFYLPQFHPIVENDVWWGAGFTEWTRVAAAKPWFRGHNQPRLPGELGFYDLRVGEVLERQAALAQEYGVGAFCFYYYWFGGRRLLERPLDEFLANPQIDMPFCLCWANEPWTRRWDGLDKDILIDQPHTREADARFIIDVLPILQDQRYLHVNGKPLLLVYRPALMADPAATTELWRQRCRDAGLGEIELAGVEAFDFEFPDEYGFDSTVEFPPHNYDQPGISVKPLKGRKQPPFAGTAYRYADAQAFYCSQPPKPWRRYRGVMPSWDNTPRRGPQGHVFYKSSPARYAVWLASALADTRTRMRPGERLVFINAWNEWGESAVLEPEQRLGRRYLEATRDVLQGCRAWRDDLALLKQIDLSTEKPLLTGVADRLEAHLEATERSLKFLTERLTLPTRQLTPALATVPPGLTETTVMRPAKGFIDKIGLMQSPQKVRCHKRYPIRVQGWMVTPSAVAAAHDPIYWVMTHLEEKTHFFALIHHRCARRDILTAFKKIEEAATEFAGFEGVIDCSALPDGDYGIWLLAPVLEGGWGQLKTRTQIQLWSA